MIIIQRYAVSALIISLLFFGPIQSMEAPLPQQPPQNSEQKLTGIDYERQARLKSFIEARAAFYRQLEVSVENPSIEVIERALALKKETINSGWRINQWLKTSSLDNAYRALLTASQGVAAVNLEYINHLADFVAQEASGQHLSDRLIQLKQEIDVSYIAKKKELETQLRFLSNHMNNASVLSAENPMRAFSYHIFNTSMTNAENLRNQVVTFLQLLHAHRQRTGLPDDIAQEINVARQMDDLARMTINVVAPAAIIVLVALLISKLN